MNDAEVRSPELAGRQVDVVWYPNMAILRIGKTAEINPPRVAVGEFISLSSFLRRLGITVEDCATALDNQVKE
jgi:hypothetical protein